MNPKQIKEFRKKHNLTMEDLASRLGVCYATIIRWENGKTKPSRLSIKRFEQVADEMERVGK